MKNKLKGKRGIANKTAVIALVVLAVIIAVTFIIVITVNNKNNQNNNNTQVEEEVKDPETKPSISGNDNIKEEDGVKTNTSSKIKENKKYLTYTFSNISLQATSEGTVLLASVSSTSTEKLQGKDITIKFYDKNGKYVSKMNSYIGQIKPGTTISFRAESTSDLSNAYNFEIVDAD